MIAVPLLVLGFGMEQPIAQRHSPGADGAQPAGGLVALPPAPSHAMPWQAIASIAVSTALTTWLIVHVATRMDPLLLRAIFSVFMVLLAIRLWRTAQRHPPSAPQVERRLNLRVLPFVGMVGGCSMALLGIGGGLMAGPLLSGWLGQRQTTAQGLSLALVAPSSVVALATYAGAHRVDWALGVPMTLGGLLTVSAGVALAHRLPERPMRLSFAAILMATALWLVAGPQPIH
nr:sulfite exporter TauE/SafE family protein [Aquabacterium sp.]